MGRSPVLGARWEWLQLELQGKQLEVIRGVPRGPPWGWWGWGRSLLFTPRGNGTWHKVGAHLRVVGRFVECTPGQSATRFGFVIVQTYLEKVVSLKPDRYGFKS